MRSSGASSELRTGASAQRGGPGILLLGMALAAALGTSTIYPLQPAIADVAQSLDVSIAVVGVALACGPVGDLVGLGLLVPLVDRYPPGRVLGSQFLALAGALATCAVVTEAAALGAAVGAVGACSAVGAGLSSLTARLAAPRRRAVSLGVVTAGISAGVLAGRVLGGWMADAVGWRPMLMVFAVACAIAAAWCLTVLPSAAVTTSRGYLSTLRSLPGLVVRDATLRVASLRGALWFFAFCAVWAGLSVALSAAPYGYSAGRIGLYALAGLSGILVTPVAGALTDRIGAGRVVALGLTLAGVAAATASVSLGSTPVLLVWPTRAPCSASIRWRRPASTAPTCSCTSSGAASGRPTAPPRSTRSGGRRRP